MMSDIRIWINDQEVKAKVGQTIMQAADAVGTYIPRLCYHPALEPSGSCRLCAVEIEGYRGLPAACSTPVEEGMRIQTQTPKVIDFRREMLRLILQDHPRECLGCPRNGSCELQQLVAAVGIDFPYPAPSVNRPPAMPGGRYFERDYSLCVRCGRCVRICHEVRGARAIVFREVAGRQEVGTPFDRPLEAVGCEFCGACVDVCPVGALRDNLQDFHRESREHIQAVCERLTAIVTHLYKKELESIWKTGICPVCGAGCRLLYELSPDGDIMRVKPDVDGPSNRGQACVQGRFLLNRYRGRPDRLQKPLIDNGGGLKETDWETALHRAAEAFKAHAPGAAAVLTDGRATNEELYALKRFAEDVLKTPAVAVVSPEEDAATSLALQKELGLVGCTNSYADLPHAGTILAFGFAPAATHPIAGTRIREAVLGGSKLIVANPYDIAIARYAHIHLRYAPGTELPLICGLIRVMVDNRGAGEQFAAKHADELKAVRKSLEPYDLETVSHLTGIHEELLVEAGCMLAAHHPVAALFGRGLTRSPDAAEAVRALCALVRMTDSLGRPGGGVAPLYGTSNLQGARNLGFRFDGLELLKAGKIKALYLAMETYEPDLLDALAPLLGGVDFVAVQDVVRPPENLKADVALPQASIMEKEGSLTNLERRVQWTEAVLDPPGDAKPVFAALSALAERMGTQSFLPESAEALFVEAARSAAGSEGISMSRAKFQPVQWPCPTEDHPGTPVLFEGEEPAWNGWRAPALRPQDPEESPDADFPYRAVTKESLRPAYSGPLLAPEALAALSFDGEIEMNPADAYPLGCLPGDAVNVSLRLGELSGRLALNIHLPRGLVAVLASMMQAVSGGTPVEGRVYAAKVEKK